MTESIINKDNLLQDYSFEVFWKNERTALVEVKGPRVYVQRFCIHPLRQLFAADIMSRNQLNEILALRCFDKSRPDREELLRAMGLTDYQPCEIVKRTHGVTYNDFIWFRFPGENLRAEDVLVRR